MFRPVTGNRLIALLFGDRHTVYEQYVEWARNVLIAAVATWPFPGADGHSLEEEGILQSPSPTSYNSKLAEKTEATCPCGAAPRVSVFLRTAFASASERGRSVVPKSVSLRASLPLGSTAYPIFKTRDMGPCFYCRREFCGVLRSKAPSLSWNLLNKLYQLAPKDEEGNVR